MPPSNTAISILAVEAGITEATLYHWRKQAKSRGLVVSGDGKNAESWSPSSQIVPARTGGPESATITPSLNQSLGRVNIALIIRKGLSNIGGCP